MRGSRRLIGEVATHSGKRYEDFVDIPAVVARVLLLFLHDPDHGVGNVVEVDRLIHRTALGEELFGRVTAEECYPPGLVLIVPVVEAAGSDAETTNFTELWIRTGHQQRGCIVRTMRTNTVLLEFRNRVLAILRFGLHCRNVNVFPMNDAPSPRAACLKTGTSVKDDHYVLAEVLGLVFLTLA